jgi:hypothetical protein
MNELISNLQKFDKKINIVKFIDEHTFAPKLKIIYGSEIIVISFTQEQIQDLIAQRLSYSIYSDMIISQLKETKYYLRKNKLKRII